MPVYRILQIRDDALHHLDRLHMEREKKLSDEIQRMQQQSRNNPSHQQLKHMWTLEAKLEGEFAYMRRLLRTEGFVVRSMSDFDGLDTNGNDYLDPDELQEFIRKRDGANMTNQILEKKTRELRQEVDQLGEGKVGRVDWLVYLAKLHWQVFQEDNVVEKMVEHITEYRVDFLGSKTIIAESVIAHPAVPRSVAQLARDPRNLSQTNTPGLLQPGMFGGTVGPSGVPLTENAISGYGGYGASWGNNVGIVEYSNMNTGKCCCLGSEVYGSVIGTGYGAR